MVELGLEFDRLRATQRRARQRRRNRRPLSRRAKIALAIPGVLFLIAAIIVGPVIYRSTRAYQQVFVPAAPHDTSDFVAQEQDNGTTLIVTATATVAAIMPEWDGKDRLTILLLGVDRREDEASRSDTMILVNIDPVTKSASMLSIPRDLKVIVPGYGVHKINAAYAFGDADKDRVPGGGPGLTMRTIESNFGIRVNYYAQVDFQGFVKIVDTLGGLTLDVPYPIKDDEYPGPGNQFMRIFFEAGWQHLDGDQVLQYSRTRHDDGDGRRSARQQQVLLALRAQTVNLNLLPKAGELIGELGNAVRTDLQPTQALALARLGSELDANAIKQFSLDSALTEEELPDQPYFLVADWSAVGDIMSQFMGVPVTPPLSALANPSYDIPITIEDGTLNPGLGGRVADVLRTNGFTNVTVVDRPDAGNYPTTSITTGAPDLSTAYLIAGLVGVPVDDIDVSESDAQPTVEPQSTSSSPTSIPSHIENATPFAPIALFPTPTAGAGSTGTTSTGHVVILLGDDAQDPAYFTSEPFTDELVPSNTTETSQPDPSFDQAPVDDTVDQTIVDDGSTDDSTLTDGSVDITSVSDGTDAVDTGGENVPLDDSGATDPTPSDELSSG